MQTYPTTGPVELSLRLGTGMAEVRTTDASTASVEITGMDDTKACRQAVLQTQVTMIKNRLTIETPDCRSWLIRQPARVSVRVEVPTGSELDLRTAAAPVKCTGSYGQTRIASGAAEVDIDSVTGSLSAKAGSGDLRFGQVDGDMVVRNGSGDLTIGQTSGTGKITLASGDIEIGSATGTLAAVTASGRVTVAQAGQGDISIKSASGKVKVGVLSGTRTWLNISSAAGRTSTDLTMTGNTAADDTPVPDLSASDCPILRLKVRTASGSIDVLRAEAQPSQLDAL